mgnify:FL=1
MAFVITLNFNQEINTSVQVGDNVYHSIPNLSGGFDVINNSNPPIHVGEVYSITSPFEMEVYSNYECQNTTTPGCTNIGDPLPVNFPSNDSYISFSKNGGDGVSVNQNELLGYYTSVKLINDSKKKAELFSVGAIVTENSK